MAYGIALIVSGSRGNRLLFLCTETGIVISVYVLTHLIVFLTIRQIKYPGAFGVFATVSTRARVMLLHIR